MPINLRSLLIHNLTRRLQRILMLQPRRPPPLIPLLLLHRHHLLLLGMPIQKQILYRPQPRCALIHRKTRRELLVRPDLDRVQHRQREVLAVVADEIVGGAFGAHVMDRHFAGLAEGFVVETRFAHDEGGPF
jgi:hypothetical protein